EPALTPFRFVLGGTVGLVARRFIAHRRFRALDAAAKLRERRQLIGIERRQRTRSARPARGRSAGTRATVSAKTRTRTVSVGSYADCAARTARRRGGTNSRIAAAARRRAARAIAPAPLGTSAIIAIAVRRHVA